MTDVYTMDEKTGKIDRVATYSIGPKQALIAFIMQSKKNMNFWTYPQHIEGMRESTKKADHWYFDDIANSRILAAYPVR